MLKTTKKLVLNRERVRTLLDKNLERVRGGVLLADDSSHCSTDAQKCYSAQACGRGTGVVFTEP